VELLRSKQNHEFPILDTCKPYYLPLLLIIIHVKINQSYSPQIGLIFVFNLIIGPGSLTLPAVVQETGWLLSGIFIATMAFLR